MNPLAAILGLARRDVRSRRASTMLAIVLALAATASAVPSADAAARPAARPTATTESTSSTDTGMPMGTAPSTSEPTSTSPSTSTPLVSVEPASAAPGDTVTLTVTGFRGRAVTAAVCGNEARRGSGDCDMLTSVSIVLNGDGSPTIAVIPVASPPAPCPCVVRVTTADFGQIAVADLDIVGHDVAEPVDSTEPTGGLTATVDARRADTGLTDRLRAGLGGAAAFEVTITLTNTTSAPLEDLTASGSFGRSESDFLGELVLDPPARLAPGQTWQQVLRVEVPARVFGTIVWRVEASAGTRTDRATQTVEQRPGILIALVLVLVADLGILATRWRIRRRRRPRDEDPIASGLTPAVDATAVR